MKKILAIILPVILITYLFTGANYSSKRSRAIELALFQIKSDSGRLSESLEELDRVIALIDGSESIDNARKALINARLYYKRTEYFQDYFFPTSSRVFNRPPKNEIEEPSLEYQAPAGFQYIEAMLFDSIPAIHKEAMRNQMALLHLSASNFNSLLYQFDGKDAQLLQSIHLQFVKIITLGLTGFDAPSLKSGIRESSSSLKAMQPVITCYSGQLKTPNDSTVYLMQECINYLDKNADFDSFNRMEFLTDYALPFQQHLGNLIKRLGLTITGKSLLNHRSRHLFSRDAIDVTSFSNKKRSASSREIALGRILFFETKLSGDNKRSCASCHNPANYFSDNLVKAAGFLSGSTLKRNTPTLLYSAFQHSQLWDGKMRSIESQIENVVTNPKEMNGNVKDILKKLNASKTYAGLFKIAFKKKSGDKIRSRELFKAIASYVKTLNPYNSRFDQYINGNRNALTEKEISGFNLFMGKAQCGTCHFAPLFNGLIPPNYTLTEYEILGTTGNDDFSKPVNDEDSGRYYVYPITFYRQAFKTPTVRNVAKTAPYMHNGAFKTLEAVIDFYDLGGGAGLGLDIPNQTLSPAKLHLSETEKENLISFLNALTDDLGALRK
jgi:cytochrome c peroxidase